MQRRNLHVVALALATIAAAADSIDLCLDPQSQLTTRVIRCYNQYVSTVSNASTTAFVNALNECFSTAGQDPLVAQGLITQEAAGAVDLLRTTYQAQFGMPVVMRVVQDDALMDEIRFLTTQNVSATSNFYVYTTMSTADLAFLDVVADLQPLINQDATGMGLVWTQVHKFYRERVAVFDGKVVSFPIVAVLPYMYYRKDVFAALNLTVPDTWEEVVAVAKMLAVTDWDPSVPGKVPLCFIKPWANETGVLSVSYLLTNIYGSMVQYKGQAQGLLYDPATMEPLVNSPPMARALSMYRQLSALMPDTAQSVYTTMEMQEGRCSLGFRWTDVFKWSPLQPRILAGKLGTSLLPGSTTVWDRSAQAWVDCSQRLCQGSDPITRPDPTDPSNNITRWVNRLLYGGPRGGYGLAINKRSSAAYKQVAYQMVAMGANVLLTNPILLMPITPIPPLLTVQLNPSNISAWLANGYQRDDVLSWLNAHLTMLAHPNTMLDFRFPDQEAVKIAIDDAARFVQLQGDNAIPSIMAQMAITIQQVVANFSGGPALFQSTYWKGIGYAPPASIPSPAVASNRVYTGAQMEPESQLSTGGIVGVAVGTVAAAILFGGLVVLLLAGEQKVFRRRSLLGKVLPPHLGPDTTLLVASVQGSTQLWDSLPPNVMESSMAVYVSALRKAADQHDGYESSTEGDTVVLAFHEPLGAVQAAVAAQEVLLKAHWPTLLLEHPLAAAQYAAASSQGSAAEPGMLVFPLWDDDEAAEEAPAITCHETGSFATVPVTMSRRGAFSPAGLWGLMFKRQTTEHRGNGSCTSQPPDCDQHHHASQSWMGSTTSMFHSTSIMRHDQRVALLAPPSQPMTTRAYLSQLVNTRTSLEEDASAPRVLLFRGLRVRMGLHTGLHDADSISVSNPLGRLQYAGLPLATATSVCSAGAGGMVLLSSTTFQAVQGVCRQRGIFLASMGQQHLQDQDTCLILYLAYSRALVFRACTQPSLRHARQLSPSFLDAPYGQVTVCFMNVVGVATLTAWSTEVTQEALSLYQQTAATELGRWGGYLVNGSGGMVLAVFLDPAHAIRWALMTICVCLEADWSPALLEHELAEEIVVEYADAVDNDEEQQNPTDADLLHAAPALQDRTMGHPARRSNQSSVVGAVDSRPDVDTCHAAAMHHQRTVLFRGLRIKCSVDIGQLRAVVEPATGRMQYFGRTMNRGARICQRVKMGQVWATSEAWDVSAPDINADHVRHREGQGDKPALRSKCQSTSKETEHVGSRSARSSFATAFNPVPEAAFVSHLPTYTTQFNPMYDVLTIAQSPEVAEHMTAQLPASGQAALDGTQSFSPQCLPTFKPPGRVESAATVGVSSGKVMFREQHYPMPPLEPDISETLPLPPAAEPALLSHMSNGDSCNDGHIDASMAASTRLRLPSSLNGFGRSFIALAGPPALQFGLPLPENGGTPRPVSDMARGWLVTGLPMGTCNLRGIQEEVSLVHCRLDPDLTPSE